MTSELYTFVCGGLSFVFFSQYGDGGVGVNQVWTHYTSYFCSTLSLELDEIPTRDPAVDKRDEHNVLQRYLSL